MPGGVGAYLSGEYGHQWLGTADAFYGNAHLPDYNIWNVGIGFTWKVFTLDLRYSDTDLSKGNCNALTSDFQTTNFGLQNVTAINGTPGVGGFGSNWCGATFIAKRSTDLTLVNNLK